MLFRRNTRPLWAIVTDYDNNKAIDLDNCSSVNLRNNAMRWMSRVSGLAIAVATLGHQGQAAAQAVPNTSPANVNVLNLLSPFLGLNATATGQATLQQNLDQSVAINNGSSTAQRAKAISDKALPGSGPNFGTITLANGSIVKLGPADNLAGGLPLQATQSNPGQPGTIAPNQPVGGYGAVLGPAYQTGIRSSTATTGPLTGTFNLLNSAYTFTSADLGVAKNYFANGAAANPSVTPPVMSLSPRWHPLATRCRGPMACRTPSTACWTSPTGSPTGKPGRTFMATRAPCRLRRTGSTLSTPRP